MTGEFGVDWALLDDILEVCGASSAWQLLPSVHCVTDRGEVVVCFTIVATGAAACIGVFS